MLTFVCPPFFYMKLCDQSLDNNRPKDWPLEWKRYVHTMYISPFKKELTKEYLFTNYLLQDHTIMGTNILLVSNVRWFGWWNCCYLYCCIQPIYIRIRLTLLRELKSNYCSGALIQRRHYDDTYLKETNYITSTS